MITSNNITAYSVLTMLTDAGKHSFENMGRVIKKSGDTVSRMLHPGSESLEASKKIALEMFENEKNVLVLIDESTIKKVYSLLMEGASWLFDTKTNRGMNAYKIIVAAISDGKFTVPIGAAFTFGKEFYDNPSAAQRATVQFFIKIATDMFPNAKIVAVLDGAFATVCYLKWAIETNQATELRMHSNRVVEYKGQKIQVRKIKEIKPKGRQMARTVQIVWQGIPLYLTAVRRIDKHGNETVVYQVATYKAKPKKHAQNYKNRWGIEKLFRTTKQSLGLQECFSRKIRTQFNHLCAVLLAYSMAQLEMKKMKYKNPEEAIRAFKLKNDPFINRSIMAQDQIFGVT